MKRLSILGTRGIPAKHGGFETFAEHLALHLVSRGWDVTVYCQDEDVEHQTEELWRGVRLVKVPSYSSGAWGTVIFDWISSQHAASRGGTILTLGYNTAAFCLFYRFRGVTNLINMDGLEWQRDKWSKMQRAWLYLNERLGCLLGNHLIADHPEIEAHLLTRVPSDKITMIPYGAHPVNQAEISLIKPFGLNAGGYALVIARPEPENSLLEIVQSFSRKRRGYPLVVLGAYQPDKNSYHQEVIAAASDEVKFIGAIYDHPVVEALRFHARAYIHGHTVGGTNPSLVESLATGTPILAHDNRFNRWVAGDAAYYFRDELECETRFDQLLDNAEELERLGHASRHRGLELFTWELVLTQYEALLERFSDASTT